MQLLKSNTGSVLLATGASALIFILLLSGLFTLVKSGDHQISTFKKHAEIRSFLFSFRQHLAVPHLCYDIFCPDKALCPSLETDNVNFDIRRFLPNHKITPTISIDKVSFNQVKRTGMEDGIELGSPFNVYTKPSVNTDKETLTRIFTNLKIDILIKFAEKQKYISNINSIFDIKIPVFFHLDADSKIAGCYAKTHKSLAYICEQQKLRSWGFKTPTDTLKCQPNKDCLARKPESGGSCYLPYTKNPFNALSGSSSSVYRNFVNKTPFFNLCLWCGE